MTEKDIRILHAKIDLLREGVISSPSDRRLEKALYRLGEEVVGLLWCRNGNDFQLLDESKSEVIMIFLSSLVQVIRSVRYQNRSLYFDCQRELFRVSGYVVHHPSYEKYGGLNARLADGGALNLVELLYAEGEWQNTDSSRYGDLFAECEWCSYFFSNKSLPNTQRLSPNGLGDMFRLWEDVVRVSAEFYPQRLCRLYQNLMRSCLDGNNRDLNVTFIDPEEAWVGVWLKHINNLSGYSVTNLDEYTEALAVINGEKAAGGWEGIRDENDNSVSYAGEKIDKLDLWGFCIESSALRSVAFFYSCCARYQRWRELRACWYLFQPLETSKSFIQHGYLTRSPASVWNWVFTIAANWEREFHDRRSARGFLYQAVLIILAEMVNQNQALNVNFDFDNLSECERGIGFIKSLRLEIEVVSDSEVAKEFSWRKEFFREKVECALYRIESELLIARSKLEAACFPDPNKYDLDRKFLHDILNKTEDSFWGGVVFKDFICCRMCKRLPIRSDPIQVVRTYDSALSFSPRSGKAVMGRDFGGHRLSQLFIARVYHLIIVAAKEEKNQYSDVFWFIPSSIWRSPDLMSQLCSIGFDRRESSYVVINGDQLLVVERGAVCVKLLNWGDMPWSNCEAGLGTFGYLDMSDVNRIRSHALLYCEVEILNANKIHSLSIK